MKDFSPLAITSKVVGWPARVGVITRTDGTVIRFAAESDEDIVVPPDTFPVVPGLQVSAVKHTSNGEMPSCQLVGVYGSGDTFDSAELDIGLFDGAAVQTYKVDRMNLSRKGLEFTGAISNITTDPINHQVRFDVKGPASSAKILMTQTRSPMCRTDLFNPDLCQLNPASYAVSTTVAALGSDSFTFTVTGSLAQADGYFNGGVLVTAGSRKLVTSNWVQSTQTITTFTPCSRLLTAGDALTLYPGCDKTDGAGGCGKFSNWINMQAENHFLGTAAAAQQV